MTSKLVIDGVTKVESERSPLEAAAIKYAESVRKLLKVKAILGVVQREVEDAKHEMEVAAAKEGASLELVDKLEEEFI